QRPYPSGAGSKHSEPVAYPDVLDRRCQRTYYSDRSGAGPVNRHRARLEYLLFKGKPGEVVSYEGSWKEAHLEEGYAMVLSSIIVRPLASLTEYELHFQFADQAFSPNPSLDSAR